MSQNGKGSKPRPYSVDYETYSSNWDNIFKKKTLDKDKEKMYPVGVNKDTISEE